MGRHVFLRGIDQTVGRAGAAAVGLGLGVGIGGGEPAPTTATKTASPLGVVTNLGDQSSISDGRATGEGGEAVGSLQENSSRSESESSGNQEANRAAEETAGRPTFEKEKEKVK